ncbi:MAG: hypothetical protein LBR38_08305 [Synergistaceae bacterium]|jgi:hypothetical protein|nr:hypothetical protein [Synergistaceae bacterium]
MLKTVIYVVRDSMSRYLKQEGLIRTLGIIRRRLAYRVVPLWDKTKANLAEPLFRSGLLRRNVIPARAVLFDEHVVLIDSRALDSFVGGSWVKRERERERERERDFC